MIIQPGTYAKLTPDRVSVEDIRVFTSAVEADGTRIIPVTMTAKPGFNAATQKVVQNGWTVNANDVTPIWQVVALSQAELDEAAEKTTTQTLITLADQFIAGTGTAAQVREALGRIIKRLAKKGILP